MEENEVQTQGQNSFSDFLNNPAFVETTVEQEQVQETVQEQVEDTSLETKTEQEPVTTESNTEDEIEDRIVGFQNQEKAEVVEEKPKTEKKVELKKATIPFLSLIHI